MLVYTPQITNRIKYIFDFVFSQYIGINYTISISVEEFKLCTTEKIGYTNDLTNNDFCIGQSNLLLEDYIKEQIIETTVYNNINCPFPTSRGILPFDIFAACFYLITRYEEYLPHQQNKYGQFQAKDSLAFKNNFLHLPVIDIWLEDFKSILQKEYPEMVFKQKKFTAQMTYDIDTAYAFKGRSVGITLGGIIRNYWNGKLDLVKRRFKTVFGNAVDLYDTYSHIVITNKELQKPIFFFLVGERSNYNKNIFFQSQAFIQLIDYVKNNGIVIGLHPSYESPRDSAKMQLEKERLEYVSKQSISCSRQHYLRFFLPTTYNKLVALGITDEYSMAYAELPGFRASTCSSFYFYDVVKDEKTNLCIHPVAFMEGTFAEDLQLQPEAALQQMISILNEVKKVNGSFISIWHNHTLSDYGFWKGWKNVHDSLIKECIK